MKVYVIVNYKKDDGDPRFADFSPESCGYNIIDLYETKESAEKNLDSYIKKNKYSAFPYYGIEKIKVKS